VTESGLDGSDSPSVREVPQLASGSTARALLGVVVAGAVLYIAKDILMPLAVAAVLALLLSPMANLVERFLGRLPGTLLSVVLAVGAITIASYYFTVELGNMADDLVDYSDNIADKINAIQIGAPPIIQRIEGAIEDIRQQLSKSEHKRRQPPVVQALPPPPSVSEKISPTLPILAALGQLSIVLVLLFFLLFYRADLRDRLVRISAQASVAIPPEALDTVGDSVSQYLFRLTVINFAFGAMVGASMWFLGLPRPMLWALMAFALRYIPYLGVIACGALATLVAIAVFPEWRPAIETFTSFVLIDLIISQLLEPFWIGAGVGISPVALLVSAMFWGWLWGPVGLILATPFTVCLKVAGDYLPSLNFLSILLGHDGRAPAAHAEAVAAPHLAAGIAVDDVSARGETRSAN
jgi:predicted PurR-regulated permease PerM